MFHGIQVAIMLALMTNIIQFAYWKQRGKSQKPIYLLCLATLLVMVQPTSMLVIGSYHDAALATGGLCISQISPVTYPVTNTSVWRDCVSEPPFGNFLRRRRRPKLTPNTSIGWCIQIFGTYGGFLLMFVAVFEVTQLGKKLKKRWVAIREAAA
ncbi:hypothetical protein JL720_15494 [Aureococcus anophagefferens]|nr:hypothetical protein JL720_15494 [Aureococcus anophagefferens]